MTLVGLDLNATRARAVTGSAGDALQRAALEPPQPDLPLALSLKGEATVGTAGLRLARRSPYLAQLCFLPELGQPRRHGQETAPEQRRLDGTSATVLLLERLFETFHPCKGIFCSVPPYLTTTQVGLLFSLSEEVGLPLRGVVSAPLAAALAARASRTWTGTAIILDVDDHALTVSALAAVGNELQLLEARTLMRLGLRAWTERLLDALADRCILQSRRDPRDCPAAEQALFEQLDGVLDAWRAGQSVQVAFQATHWYQRLALTPLDGAACCAALARRALAEIAEVCTAPWPTGAPGVVLMTTAAARLPGLVAGVEASFAAWRAASSAASPVPSDDFGEGLLDEEEDDASAVEVLAPDALARAAHALAVLVERGDLPVGQLDVTAPLPVTAPADAGPVRLRYQGHEYLLDRSAFVLGWQPTCDLVFACDAYPTVSPRHCEIVCSTDVCTLHDRSRTGTFLNDEPVKGPTVLRAGDSIRLGSRGPVLRFLGGVIESRPVNSSA